MAYPVLEQQKSCKAAIFSPSLWFSPKAFSNNLKRVKFQKAPENEKIVKLAQKNQKINPIQLTKTKTINEILAEPQPSKEKADSFLLLHCLLL